MFVASNLLHRQTDDVVDLVRKGDLKRLQEMAVFNPQQLEEPDELGWTPLHEGVRSGNVDVVKFLLSRGADKDLLTKAGLSPIWISQYYLGINHNMTVYLKEVGAVLRPPNGMDKTENKDEL